MELTVDGFVAHGGEANGQSRHPVSRRPLDLIQLARYTLGNRSHEREILELFRRQSGLYLARLRDAANDKAWRDVAHTIKGSADCIGAWRVADTAAAAETLEGDALASSRNEIVEALERRIDETNAFIRRLLADA